MNVETGNSKTKITPKQSLESLKAGNKRYLNGNMLKHNYMEQTRSTANRQHPHAIVLSCIDSRIPTEIIFDQGIGDIFNARISGNFVNIDILGSMEYACKLAGSKLILVMGHTSCGAIKAACDGVALGNITPMLEKIKPAVESVNTAAGEVRNSSNMVFVNDVARKNVVLAIDSIRKASVLLDRMYNDGEIDIVGAIYDVNNGRVEFFKHEK